MTEPPPSRTARLRALGRALGDAGAHLTGRVEEMHRSIAGRAFAAAGPGAAPVRTTHDAISAVVYASVRGGARLGGRAAGVIGALTPLGEGEWLEGPRLAFLEGAVCGALGDHVEERHAELAPRMAVRLAGRDVAVEPAALAGAFPRAERRVAVFLHGLCETEAAWGRPALDDDALGTYGDRLRRHLGHSPVFLRYNSGLRVAENGRRFAELLDRLVTAWPVELEELVLIGHSMGGLVVRSACLHGERWGLPWVGRVRHCVYLGTPHDGAALERAARRAAGALRLLPETRALASAIEVRSAGIRDLAHPELGPLLASARHHAIAATVGASPHHLSSRLLGDTLVPHASALGHGRSGGAALALDEDDRHHLGGLHHFSLLDHPLVYERLRHWLAQGV
ncbi:MAG: PGAP1-like protein [Chloroflexi bacterium]|nr:PGAP1-like protein [Chloroflexota bacterium]